MRTLLVFIISFFVCYCLTAFINLSFDPSTWTMEGRLLFVFVSIFFSGIVAKAYEEIYED